MNLKSISDSKNDYEDIKKKYEEIKEKYSKMQIELIKKEKEFEKIKNENDRYKKKTNNDTSSDYPWPKEFSEKWINFVQNLIMDCFENCCNDNFLLTKIVNCIIKVVYNVARYFINEKIIELYKCLGINNPNQDDIIFFFEKFKVLLFQVYFKSLFHFNDEIFSTIISKIKNEIDEINKEQNLFKYNEIELINKDLDSNEITYLFKELFYICIYMYIHEPTLYFDLIYEDNYYFYSKKDYIIIDGFEKENAVCTIILNPPIFKSKCFYRELKPAVKIIDNPTNDMIEKCKYNQFLNEKSKSSKIISIKKPQIEIIEQKKVLIEKIIKTPENIFNSKNFFSIHVTNSLITNRSLIPISASKILKKCESHKKKKQIKFQNFNFKGLEIKLNKNIKKNKLKTSLDTFINRKSKKNMKKNISLSDSEQEKNKKEIKQKESSRSNLFKLHKNIKDINISRNNISIDFDSHSKRYHISDNLLKKMFTEFSSPRSLKEKLAFFKKLSFERRRTYSLNLPSKKKNKKFNTINFGNKIQSNDLTRLIQKKKSFSKNCNKKKQITDLFQLGLETNIDILNKKLNSQMLRNNSQKSKVSKGDFCEKLKNNLFTSSNSSLSKHKSHLNSISESLSYKNINSNINTFNNFFTQKKKKLLSQTQPLKFINDYITLNMESTNIKTRDIDESNSGLITSGNNFKNNNLLSKLRNKNIKKKNNFNVGKKSDIFNYETSINNIKKTRFNSPIQRKSDINGIYSKIKNSNLGNCNSSKISEIKTYFVQFQKDYSNKK